MKGKLTLLLIALVALTGGGAIAVNTVTLFDDGDPVNATNGIYDLGGAGRPAAAATASGHTYNGDQYLTVWADTARHRNQTDVAAYVRNDVALDMSGDWYVQIDMTNDLVVPDIGLCMWLVNFKPDGGANTWDMSWWPNGNLTDRSGMFWFRYWDQLAGDNVRSGFSIDTWLVGQNRVSEALPGARLDPDPDEPMLRGGHNYVTLQWSAAEEKYSWRVANLNGAREWVRYDYEMGLHPAEAYFLVGNVDEGSQEAGYTIWSINYGAGVIPEPGSLCALGMGLAGLVGFVRRRR